jgi:hypothetical protein
MQKRGQASPDDGEALALTFARPVEPAEVEEEDEEEAFGRYSGSSSSVDAMTPLGGAMVSRWRRSSSSAHRDDVERGSSPFALLPRTHRIGRAFSLENPPPQKGAKHLLTVERYLSTSR